ncbi:hypothetical protein G7046_g6440 [Stylonectria norvegica]|nr:hypothetical protein G7046_g6440 [Stylonectria norvegica]
MPNAGGLGSEATSRKTSMAGSVLGAEDEVAMAVAGSVVGDETEGPGEDEDEVEEYDETQEFGEGEEFGGGGGEFEGGFEDDDNPDMDADSVSNSQSVIVKMAERVHRVTMFKLPKYDDVQKALEQYKILAANQQKDGKPYILSLVAGPAEDDERAQGYTLISKTEFANMDDMKYYDDECKAHSDLKAFVVRELTVEGVLTTFFKAKVTAGEAA